MLDNHAQDDSNSKGQQSKSESIHSESPLSIVDNPNNDDAMRIEENENQEPLLPKLSQNIENRNSSDLVNLFQNYTNFMRESTDVTLDMNLVLARLLEAIKTLKPPPNASSNINDMWNFLLEMNKEGVDTAASSLKNLPSNVVYDVLQNAERLYLKLMIEFDHEINRGKRLGIIHNDANFS